MDGSDAETHSFRYDRSDSQSVGVSITRAVASVAGVDPLSLEPRLYDVVDPDAVETLLTSGGADSEVEITFSLGAYEVTVEQAGRIIVRDDTTSSH